MKPKATDTRDVAASEWRQMQFDKRSGPRVGDYIVMCDGSIRRFTYEHSDGLQTTMGPLSPCAGDESFYMSRDGRAEYSGSLDSSVPFRDILPTPFVHVAPFWFFHLEQARAHNGVRCDIRCRVYLQRNAMDSRDNVHALSLVRALAIENVAPDELPAEQERQLDALQRVERLRDAMARRIGLPYAEWNPPSGDRGKYS